MKPSYRKYFEFIKDSFLIFWIWLDTLKSMVSLSKGAEACINLRNNLVTFRSTHSSGSRSSEQ